MGGGTFEEALDAAQEYMALQEALGAALRAGFLSLAQARYSMGADRVSSLQLPAHMTATARLRAEQGQLELVRSVPKPQPPAASSSSEATSSGRPAAGTAPAASSGSSSSSSADAGATHANAGEAAPQFAAQTAAQGSVAGQRAAGEPDNVAALLQRMQLLAQQSNSLVDELAAKYCSGPAAPDTISAAAAAPSSSAAGGDLDAEYEEVAHPSRPLHWFGSLVAPSLRDAEGHFCRALELVVQAANAQAALRRGLERQLAAAAGGGGAAAAAAGANAAS